MANPQKENGHIEIATEIWEHLTKMRVPGQARQVLDLILRKTYGWNKKEDIISLSQFVKGTDLPKTSVCKGINKLLEMGLIAKKGSAKSLFTQKGNDDGITYRFIKDYKKWKPLPKKVTLPKKVKHVTQKVNQTLPKKGHTIDTITKDTITINTIYPLDFEKFWKAYPKKVEKQYAFKCWKKSKKPPIEIILKSIETQKQSDQWQKDNGQFIPKPSTWINRGRWEDETTQTGDTLKAKLIAQGRLTPEGHPIEKEVN